MTKLRLCLLTAIVSGALLAVVVPAVSGDDPGGIRVAVTEDAYITNNGPHGTAPLYAGSWGTLVYRSYLKFKLPDLPEDTEVKKVTLSVYSLVTGNSPPEIAVCPAGSEWSESGITWADAPPVGEPCDKIKIVTKSGEYRWNVTKAVEPALTGEVAADGPGSDGSFTLVLTEAAVVADGWTKMANRETYPTQAAYLLIDTGSPDVTPPEISFGDPKQTLWPPNHKMVLCAVLGVTDDTDQAPAITQVQVTSNEPINGKGDGNTDDDWRYDPDTGEVWLRAERDGTGEGRTYTVYVEARDATGNVGSASMDVIVPRDQG